MIYHVKDNLVPQFAFEWHEESQKVYMLEIPGEHIARVFVPATSGQIRAVVIAEYCDTHGLFIVHVQTWLRGYKKALSDIPKLKDSALVADIDRITNSGLLRGEKDGKAEGQAGVVLKG